MSYYYQRDTSGVSMAAKYDVFCYGAISVDVSGLLDAPLRPGAQTSASDLMLSPGGDALLVALACADLGLRAGLGGGPVGSDARGGYIAGLCRDAGVDLLARGPGPTSLTAVALERSGARTAVTFHEGKPFAEIPVPAGAIRGCRCLYADGCYGPNAAMAARAAHEGGALAVLNLDRAALEFVSLFDVVISSWSAAALLSADPAGAARQLVSRGAKMAIVTMGEKGCVGFDGALVRLPALPAEAVDTTGAGSAFAAGFIFARLGGRPFPECLRLASAAGALKCEARGSHRKISKEDLDIFLDSHK